MTEADPDTQVAGRLWGARFAEEPDDAAWRLGVSTDVDVRLWPYDIAGSRAHADELARLDLLSAADHGALRSALDVVAAELADGTFALADGDEDIHGAIERRLVELAGDAGGRLRAGRSRNDQIANDLRLYLRDATAQLIGAVRALQTALADQAERLTEAIAPGYTHLQRAQPTTLAHHLLAHAWALERDVGRLRDAAARADESVLGAGALAGLTLDLDPARYAEALGFARVAPNSMDAVADRDCAVEVMAACALIAVHCSRLGEEVVLWSSTEFGWARVGDGFSTGSSIMPQKRNPDVAELIRGKTGRVIGDLVALLVTLKGLPLTYNRDLQEDKEPVFDAVDTVLVCLPAMAGTVASLRFDTDRVAATAAGGFALATDVAEALVRAGVPFRRAHEEVGALVASCEADGIDIVDVAPAALREKLPALRGCTDDELAGLVDADAAVARRRASLGPAPEQVRRQLDALRAHLRADPSAA